MRINPISYQWQKLGISNRFNYLSNPVTANSSNLDRDTFVKSPQKAETMPKAVFFMGRTVYLVDGGNHAKDMNHFAKAIDSGKNMTIHTFETQDPIYSSFDKPLKNVEDELKKLYYSDMVGKDDFVAVPLYVNVPLQNLEAQYKEIMGKDIDLKPYNVLSHKKELLEFLDVIAKNPEKYEKYLRYMDPDDNGIEYTAGIIEMINKLNCHKIYVPASHPHEASLRWMAEDRGCTPELINYLATGYDRDGKINGMLNEIKNNGWYDFNLLTLSNADVVNLKKSDGFTDHMFSAYDTAVKDGARGVFNLTPIRNEKREIVGYSFVDRETNDYPIGEFPYTDDLRDISKFVGLSVQEAVADREEIERFKEALSEHRDMLQFADKLYPVWEVFSSDQLWREKIYDRGDFVDYKLENFFRRNEANEIIYPLGDCENSGRPSVKSMSGSTYSMFSAIRRDIDNQMFYERVRGDGVDLKYMIELMLDSAQRYAQSNNYESAEVEASKVLRYIDMVGFDPKNKTYLEAYKTLADIKYTKGDYAGANGLYNFYLNNKCKAFEDKTYEDFADSVNERKEIASLFEKLADIAIRRGEGQAEYECKVAANCIVPTSRLGYKIVNRRANDDNYIGDLVNNEVK